MEIQERDIRWEKNVQKLRDENDKKYIVSDLITKEYTDVVKEDVLNAVPYQKVSQVQQMIYHAFKKIEELEKRVRDLEELALLTK